MEDFFKFHSHMPRCWLLVALVEWWRHPSSIRSLQSHLIFIIKKHFCSTSRPQAHFTNHLSIIIQIWWKICFTVIQFQTMRSQQNFAHAMTAHLLCHVQKIVVISSSQLGGKQNDTDIKVELQWKKIVNEMGPYGAMMLTQTLELSPCMQACNWPTSQIPQCTCSISHKAPFRTEMCTFLLWMMHCGIWIKCIVGLVRMVYCAKLSALA